MQEGGQKSEGIRFNQIKPSLTEEQYIIQAKCYRCYSFSFFPSLLSLLWQRGVKHDIRPNDLNMLLFELAAGVFTNLSPPLYHCEGMSSIQQSLLVLCVQDIFQHIMAPLTNQTSMMSINISNIP